MTKTLNLGHVGPKMPIFGVKKMFSKSAFVTFLHILKANLMQKSNDGNDGKFDGNGMMGMLGSLRTFVTDLAD